MKHAATHSILIYTLLLLLSFQSAIGQDTLAMAQDSILPEKEVEVIKSFEARLSKARRVSINPELPAVNTTPRYYHYDVSIIPIDIAYPDPEIRPLAMKPEPDAEHKHGYLRLAAGSLQGIDGSASYYYHHQDNYRLGAQLDVYNIKDGKEENEVLSQRITALLYGQYDWTDIYKLNTSLSGNLHKVQLRETVEQRNISNAFFKAGIEKISEDYKEILGKIDIELGFTDIDDVDLNDFYIKTPIRVNKAFSDFTGVEFTAKTELNIASQENLDTDFIYGGGLAFYHLLNGISLRVGLDYLGHDGDHSVFPDIEIAYPLSNNLLTPFIRSNQSYLKNSLSNIIEQNPYFVGSMEEINTNVSQKVSGGIKGLLSNELSYELEGGYKIIKNQGYYLDNNATFSLAEDDLNAVFIAATADWEIRDWLQMDITAQKLFFQDEPLFGLQHIPDLELRYSTEISTNPDLYYISSELLLVNGMRYLGVDDGQLSLDPIIALNLAAGYHITDKIELYGEGNNLLNRENTRWLGYLGFGLQVLGGVKAVF